MISEMEMRVQLRNTKAFIDADAEEITIIPRSTRVPDGAGGWVDETGPLLPPVRVRIVPVDPGKAVAFPAEGRLDTPEHTLVAMPGTDIQRYDKFRWRGKMWLVDKVHNKPDYELKANLVIDNG